MNQQLLDVIILGVVVAVYAGSTLLKVSLPPAVDALLVAISGFALRGLGISGGVNLVQNVSNTNNKSSNAANSNPGSLGASVPNSNPNMVDVPLRKGRQVNP